MPENLEAVPKADGDSAATAYPHAQAAPPLIATPAVQPPAAGVSAREPAATPPPSDQSLDSLRLNIAGVIQRYFQPLFLLTVGTALFLFVIIAVGLFADSPIATMALAASVQVAFGMIIGYVCVYIGLMMTWFGIDASYSFKGSLGAGGAKGEGTLKSASPGLLFALGGMVLIAVSLYKPIVFEEKGGLPTSVRSFPSLGGDDAESVTPLPPPPRPKRGAAEP